jgi:hypothetical protein
VVSFYEDVSFAKGCVRKPLIVTNYNKIIQVFIKEKNQTSLKAKQSKRFSPHEKKSKSEAI